jgi:hypothetical protein
MVTSNTLALARSVAGSGWEQAPASKVAATSAAAILPDIIIVTCIEGTG